AKGDGRAGDRPGLDYYETDVSLEELIDIMFEDLELPNLERRALREIPSDRSTRRKGYRHVGIRVRLDKRRTARQRVMRALATGRKEDLAQVETTDENEGADVEEQPRHDPAAALQTRVKRRFPFHQDDLRYKHLETDVREDSNAVVICIMDT